jgi:hypothetical protein
MTVIILGSLSNIIILAHTVMSITDALNGKDIVFFSKDELYKNI